MDLKTINKNFTIGFHKNSKGKLISTVITLGWVTLLGQWDRGPLVHLKTNSSGYVHPSSKLDMWHWCPKEVKVVHNTLRSGIKVGSRLLFEVGFIHHHNRSWKISIILIFKKTNIFVNVETDPRVRLLCKVKSSCKLAPKISTMPNKITLISPSCYKELLACNGGVGVGKGGVSGPNSPTYHVVPWPFQYMSVE